MAVLGDGDVPVLADGPVAGVGPVADGAEELPDVGKLDDGEVVFLEFPFAVAVDVVARGGELAALVEGEAEEDEVRRVVLRGVVLPDFLHEVLLEQFVHVEGLHSEACGCDEVLDVLEEFGAEGPVGLLVGRFRAGGLFFLLAVVLVVPVDLGVGVGGLEVMELVFALFDGVGQLAERVRDAVLVAEEP